RVVAGLLPVEVKVIGERGGRVDVVFRVVRGGVGADAASGLAGALFVGLSCWWAPYGSALLNPSCAGCRFL
ncbi:hypothetical protein AAHH79_43845, partial [Burkholderia pseudomallei]